MLTIFFASFLFGLMAFLVKVASSQASAATILLMRAGVGLCLLVPVILVRRVAFNAFSLRSLMGRGLFGGLAVATYFYAITRIPLADASILANAYPIFTAFFSVIYLREKVKLDTLLALGLSLLGMVIIMQPHFASFDFGYVLAAVSAVSAGLAVTFVRQLRQTESSLIIMIFQIIGIIVFSLPFAAVNFSWPTFATWQLLLLIGLVSTVSQLIFTIPFKSVPAAEGSIIAISHAGFAVLFAVLFLKEPLSAQFLFGGLLVFGSSFYLIWRPYLEKPGKWQVGN